MIEPHAEQSGRAPLSVLVSAALVAAREAQRAGRGEKLGTRLRFCRNVRETLADCALEFASLSARLRGRPPAEVLTAEVLPLLEAHRFVERHAGSILRRRAFGLQGRPLWLSGVRSEVTRQPWGVVLVIAPRNYPLFLAGVQVLQALIAGNAVLWKPAPGTSAVAQAVRDLWVDAGLDERLLQVLPESVDAVRLAISQGVDHVVLTGAAETGERVLQLCASATTPSTVELSGCDAVVVREDADLAMVAQALAFGLRLNGGATCIAPRRAFVARRVAERLEAHLAALLQTVRETTLDPATATKLRPLVEEAMENGATLLVGGISPSHLRGPLVLAGVRPTMGAAQSHWFAPLLTLSICDDDEEMIRLANDSRFGLGASVFSRDLAAAGRIAERISAGVVVINDMIVPTADPRLPFGGVRRSGFGVTRGAEGLLGMTVPKVITTSARRWRPHFRALSTSELPLLLALIRLLHGSRRLASLAESGKALIRMLRKPEP